MGVTSNIAPLMKDISQRFERFATDSPQLHAALTQIAVLFQARARINIRRYGMIDTGRLINSIRYQFYKNGDNQGIEMGSYGVPYAAIHEFGGAFTAQMRRAMFANLARMGRRRKNYQSKGVIRDNYIRARPYIRPALVSMRPFTISILREALNLRS